jgi:3-phosphoshikimate 1-carboxyvinyltransferase
MDYIVSPVHSLGGCVKAPPSKSYTIRAVLCSLLADGQSTVRSPLLSRDTKAAFDACESFGARITPTQEGISVAGTAGRIRAPNEPLDTLNSGTTIRICTAIASLATEKVELTGDESIRCRPIKPLLDALKQLGVKTHSANGNPPHTVEGPLAGGACGIRGDVSSQYVSALLIAAPYAGRDVTVEMTSPLKSRPYVELTLNMLSIFGVNVHNSGFERFTVPCGQTYRSADYTVEGDYSSAAFILAAAALTDSEVEVANLLGDSMQADRKIVEILGLMGAKADAGADHVRVSSDGCLEGVTVDLSDSPDLVPIVSVLGACASGRTEIVNASHARLKECDRIAAMASELRRMGADITETDDGLVIEGGRLRGAQVDGWRDHRIIMSLAVAGLKAEGETRIAGAEHVDVTFPDFKDVMKNLGATIE